MGGVISTSKNEFSNKNVGGLKVIELFVIILVLWVLVDLWVIFFRNFAKYTLQLNENSTLHSFVFAFAVSVILIAFVILAGDSLQETLINSSIIKEELRPVSLAQNTA